MTDDELIEWLLVLGRIGEEPVLIEAASRIKKLGAALRKIKELHHGPEDEDVSIRDDIWIRDDMTYKIVCDTLEDK